MKVNLTDVEIKVMKQLKDFQVATVNRVFELYKTGQRRVLVADEVGLGKTIVAKGVIARTAKYHYENGDNLFKVVYVCSNQNIAEQNIQKLKIYDTLTVDGVSDTRLSMQHLKIHEQENDPEVLANYIQIIPLTPATSFSMTSGSGSQRERALIFAVLKRIDIFIEYIDELEVILKDQAFKGWHDWARDHYEERVSECNDETNNVYIARMSSKIKKYLLEHSLLEDIKEQCLRVREANYNRVKGTHTLIYNLRMMFARISVDLLEPDLIIMDEFQRFKTLISSDNSSESGILAKKFLQSNDTKVLLLSATPYKLYNTLEEINENDIDEHYSEFLQVMDFLFYEDSKKREFRDVWHNYSMNLRELSSDHSSILSVKRKAENSLYQGVCRTERMAAMDINHLIDDKKSDSALNITKNDILSFIQMETLVNDIGISQVPVEYIKSSPYIMSFMKEYQLKSKIEKYFKKNNSEVKKTKKSNLWLNKKMVRQYKELPKTNARLEQLKEEAFKENSELLLWVPPSKPYYELSGVFKNKEEFSKILVFSSWEMVPRMISTLVSYDYEVKTVGRLTNQSNKTHESNYFTSNNKRFPVSRLRFNVEIDIARSMNLFSLYYPSETLANLYNPIDALNKNLSLDGIKKNIGSEIQRLLKSLLYMENTDLREDDRWYYLAPLLLDQEEFVREWLSHGTNMMVSEDSNDRKGHKGFQLHVDKLTELYNEGTNLEMGRIPDDLVEVLTSMAIASPSICAYRGLNKNSLVATQMAKLLVDQFNRPEATAVIELAFTDTDMKGHWKKVLRYCVDGNLQAVVDEYVHLLIDLNGLSYNHAKFDIVFYKYIVDAMKTHAASYHVDTYEEFRERITGKKKKGMSLRTHHSVAFYKGASDSGQVKNRRESIRNSFNSPFKPFVLATTSIGQEGLDFHYYCRKIFHWNLPSNVIDFEQREGRINRFKSLAIRKNIALNYLEHTFVDDIWQELFNAAKEEYNQKHSELVPFWCFPENQKVKIERFVPTYPFSKDIAKYQRLKKVLVHYRLTLGQARQEELLDSLFESISSEDELKDMFINLSPYYRMD